jgi:hypothetical protein
MADLSDICTYLSQVVANAVYPLGTSQPSVANMDALIFEGWPIPETLDLDLTGRMVDPTGKVVTRPRGPRANISIYPMQGMNIVPQQILDETHIITPPVYGLTASAAQSQIGASFTITLTGTPGPTEFLTIEIDNTYIASSGGVTNTAILNALAASINTFSSLTNPLIPGYVATVSGGDTLTITGAANCVARLGAQGTLGKVTHKEQQSVMVTVWAPDHASRTAFAIAIDGLIKHNLTVTMPDTSMALIVYNRTNVTDEFETVAVYRRDLIYSVLYATVWQFPGTVITSVSTTVAPVDPVNSTFVGVTTAA